MKKHLYLSVLVIMIFSLAACSAGNSNENSNTVQKADAKTTIENSKLKEENKEAVQITLQNVQFNLEAAFNQSDMAKLSSESLAILRNAIYAKYGYVFSNNKYADLFSKLPWYKPANKDVGEKLNSIDKQNINAILLLEKNQTPSSGASGGKKDFFQIGSTVSTKTLDYMFGGEDLENVLKKLGEPQKQVQKEIFERWYFKNGVEIDVVSESDVPTLFNYIYLGASSPIKTDRKIGIGSTKEDVLKAYQEEINPQLTNTGRITVGGVFVNGDTHDLETAGIVFIMKEDKVCAMYIPTGAFTTESDIFER